ncbi:hypothetical protein OIY81_2701 [Cryptosporidium canis]|uniref:Signal peptide-containing protein n=1 Tax=Cryptosporidium canis TaxID=195482 RepID=A0ABQ8PA31_9CRYT|nr:hypothetical protein OIY81_2701 [Cryptosporidium canis]KAJ1614304.1 hypothetical protein OJ252_715 [Cryptosporidium canis]
MRTLLVLLLFISLSESIFGVQREQRADGSVVSGPQVYNNLKVNNQVRAKSEVGDVRSSAQSKAGKMDKSVVASRSAGVAKQDGTGSVHEVQGYSSLRTSEIIYNGTQVLTLIFFISVIIFGLFILTIALVPKYARRFGFRTRMEIPAEPEADDSGLNIEKKASVGRETSLGGGSPLLFTKVKNHSLRRHSMVSDGSSESCRIATRPRSSSSLPSVQAFNEGVDESTTGDESSTRTSRHGSNKNLKKRPYNNDLVARVYRTHEQGRLSNLNNNGASTQREGEGAELSPTSASAVVAIQMSELIARWNPKKDSRLIQKANPMTFGRHPGGS